MIPRFAKGSVIPGACKSPHILKKIKWQRSHRQANSQSLAEIDVREDGGARADSQIGLERVRQAKPFHFISISINQARA
jgi:hypothetical protein